jgi:hypothetical protein
LLRRSLYGSIVVNNQQQSIDFNLFYYFAKNQPNMKDKSIEDPFYLQIQREINRIETKAKTYTGLFYAIRIIQIVLTGTITVLSGLSIDDGSHKVLILILAAVVTLITAVDTLFQVDAKKNTYKLVLFELRSIRAELVYNHIKANSARDGNQAGVAEKNELFEKYRKANAYARDLIGTDSESDNRA